MVTDFEVSKVYVSDILSRKDEFQPIFAELKSILERHKVSLIRLPKTKDIWARDYMPVQVSNSKFVEFRYDPDYLQGARKGYRNLKSYPDIICDEIGLSTVKTDIILDGGNMVKSKRTLIMTDKIFHENRNDYTKKELQRQLHSLFEIENIITIPQDPLDKYGHTDGMLRFITEDTVLVNPFYENDKTIVSVLNKTKLSTEFLKYDVKKLDKRSWAYMNFLQTKDLILLPKFNIEEDNLALEQMRKFYPNYKVEQIEMINIVKYGGALNCITWTTL
ncbi:agmatine deiminase family protein [Flammeovirga kamogawensis]|uniref:Agmatine deiminase family protein n=1 Tax=Flammeovirga kamogawensis TaxID=373891 RepID=A0ABX8H4G2_9BACT|nr:agmatine deiminase family protein [Flammeovirga kamogawensis]MBB6463880.1 agmatine/peptidylarginine deiminase [Flammeovirga kamogawensis]QWG10801.1 agmatine deiminase family protein [Flammeovirga kamogawensis]TRX63212.1 agmatine deiminase family protein [Flammeovirga kamogawensis]